MGNALKALDLWIGARQSVHFIDKETGSEGKSVAQGTQVRCDRADSHPELLLWSTVL